MVKKKKREKKTKAAKKQEKKTKETKKQEQKTPEKVYPKLCSDPILLELFNQVAGQHGYDVVKTISGCELTDDDIAKRTEMRINLVRRILYDLYDNRVVNYRRVRDENSGWYIYYWQLDPERALAYINSNRRLLLQKLEEQLELEKNAMYFSCGNGCPKVLFEQATEYDFKCPKCSEKLEHYNNSHVVTSLEHKVQSLRNQMLGS